MNDNQAPGQADDLYDTNPNENSGESKPKPEEGEGQTALIPKSLIPGDVQPGEEIVLVVKAVHEQEIEVGYAPEKKGGAAGSPPDPLEDDNMD